MKPSEPLAGFFSARHLAQTKRDPWPDFASFQRERYPAPLRKTAAKQWTRRAREEYGSVHEFGLILTALTGAAVPVEWTGMLARLITDEARHVELCRAMASALVGEEEARALPWEPPTPPFPKPPTERPFAWAADAILCTCCIGETVSVPLYETLSAVTTDPVAKGVVEQIRKDELLHSRFGWEAFDWLLPRLTNKERTWLQGRLSARLAGFERSCSAGMNLEDLVGKEIVVEPVGPDAPPNLGHQEREVYATVFYATLESEILPRFAERGFDAMGAWRDRNAIKSPARPPAS